MIESIRVKLTFYNLFIFLLFAGGHGCVKVWDVSKPGETTKSEITKLDCGIGENYVRSCKLLNNDTLLVGGESPFVSVIDLTVSSNTFISSIFINFRPEKCFK